MSPITYFSFTHNQSTKPSRRCPLTPPAVSAPTIAPFSSLPAMHRSFSSPKATTLLTKVARSSRPSSTSVSPSRSPVEKSLSTSGQENHPSYREHAEKEAARRLKINDWPFYRASSQRDGYISFPDFERYCGPHEQTQDQSSSDQRQQQQQQQQQQQGVRT